MSGTTTDTPLSGELRVLLRAGLPVREERCGPGLLALRGVAARALHPGDVSSRARALDGLLREQLRDLENQRLAGAATLLFGAAALTSGATLGVRRNAAARAAGYEVHHFRKRIEPKLLDLLAWQLRRDGDRLALRRHEPPVLRPSTRRPSLPADVFAWEAADHKHALANLWGATYLLHAELLTIARLVSMNASEEDLTSASEAALWRHAAVLHAVREYRVAYGGTLLHAAIQAGPELIGASAGWTPALTPSQELLLVEVADPAQGLRDFVARLGSTLSGAEIAAAWRRSLAGHDSDAEMTEPDP